MDMKEALKTLNHARIFITSREKMHPTGVELYDLIIDQIAEALRAALSKPSDDMNESKEEVLAAETQRADDNARSCKGFTSALRRIADGEANPERIASEALISPWSE